MTNVIGIEEIPVMRVFTACISVIGEHQISESKLFCTFLSTLENKPIRMWTLTVLVNLLSVQKGITFKCASNENCQELWV